MALNAVLDGIPRKTGLAETSRTDYYKMIPAVEYFRYPGEFFHSVCKFGTIHDSPEFKGISHIPIFFVPIFFAKLRRKMNNEK